ncbi:MAG: hypothetical protein IPN53_15350 [Comamonadaceae bacterium]|nr:hypothetical protein [Comamonadaceae bacterium]
MITYFDSTMIGAPPLSGTAGAMLGVLDACLVTGFGLQTCTSLTVVGTVATAALPAAHSLRVGAYVRIAGATPAGLNGDWPVTGVTSQGFTFTTNVAAGTATGTITSRHTPLGWAKEFSGTNLAAYRSADVTGTRMRLRVDDTAAVSSRVVGYEAMTDVDTGAGPFPTALQASGGLHWIKSTVADASARAWVLIGDSRLFYLYVATYLPYQDHGTAVCFGDYSSVRPGDPYACMLTGKTGTEVSSSYADLAKVLTSERTPLEACLAKSYSGIGSAVNFFPKSAFAITHNSNSGTDIYSGLGLSYPNGPDNGLITSPKYIFSNTALRGNFTGLLHTPQSCQAAFETGDIVIGTGSLTGRKLFCLRSGGEPTNVKNTVNTGAGVVFIDITGPWR